MDFLGFYAQTSARASFWGELLSGLSRYFMKCARVAKGYKHEIRFCAFDNCLLCWIQLLLHLPFLEVWFVRYRSKFSSIFPFSSHFSWWFDFYLISYLVKPRCTTTTQKKKKVEPIFHIIKEILTVTTTWVIQLKLLSCQHLKNVKCHLDLYWFYALLFCCRDLLKKLLEWYKTWEA